MDGFPATAHNRMRFLRCSDVLVRQRRRKFFADSGDDRIELEHAADGGKGAEQRYVRHRQTDMLQCELRGGNDSEAMRLKAARVAAQAELVQAAGRVDDDEAV